VISTIIGAFSVWKTGERRAKRGECRVQSQRVIVTVNSWGRSLSVLWFIEPLPILHYRVEAFLLLQFAFDFSTNVYYLFSPLSLALSLSFSLTFFPFLLTALRSRSDDAQQLKHQVILLPLPASFCIKSHTHTATHAQMFQ